MVLSGSDQNSWETEKYCCIDCFINSHKNLFTHWAEVWDSDQGSFVRHDIAALQDDIESVNLGHHGHPFPSQYATNLKFMVVDINGVHQTKIRFCSCQGFPIWLEQLMQAKLFPATMTQPMTASPKTISHPVPWRKTVSLRFHWSSSSPFWQCFPSMNNCMYQGHFQLPIYLFNIGSFTAI